MAVTMSDISKLRKLTGAGMMDCKKALEETNCDMDAAVEIIRKKGQAVAAKREDREASEGCVLSAATADFCAIVALKCETDFVAKNEGFVALTKAILDATVAAKAKSLDEVKELEVNGRKVADLIVEEIGKTGELEDGVKVIHRTDYNYSEVADAIKDAVADFSQMPKKKVEDIRKRADELSKKALWSEFIQYYYQAYDMALRKAAVRMETLKSMQTEVPVVSA